MGNLYDTDSPDQQHQGRDGEVMDSGALALPAGTAMQRIGGNYVTAMSVQRKRSLTEVRRALVEEARLSGERFFYGWGAGRDRIEGPSEALAFAAARLYGNCAVEPAPIQDAGDAWIFTAFFIDLETGYTYGRQFRQSKKWTVHGKLDAERKADIRFQIGATKAGRNVILKALPDVLIDDALEAAKAGVRAKIEKYVDRKGLAAAQDLAVQRLTQLNVSEERVLSRFEIAEKKALTIEHLTILQGDIKAIEDGAERPETLFPIPGAQGGNGGPPVAEKSGLDAFAEGASSEAPKPEPPPAAEPKTEAKATTARLSVGQLSQLQQVAQKAGVDWSAIEEAFGGPLRDLEISGKGADALEADVRATIVELAG